MRTVGIAFVLALLGSSCCAQSDNACPNDSRPTALYNASSTFDPSLGSVRFSFNQSDSVTVEKNVMQFNDSSSIVTISVGNASIAYRPESLQWLWGSNSSAGSQHQLEGRSYPLEAQLKLTMLSTSSGEGAQEATIAWLYAAGSQDASSELQAVARFLVAKGSESSSSRKPQLEKLAPEEVTQYYRYSCKGRQWTVAASAQTVPESTLEVFRKAESGAGQRAAKNFTQPLPLRSFNASSGAGGGRHSRRAAGSRHDGDYTRAGFAAAAQPLLLLLLSLLLPLLLLLLLLPASLA